MTTADSQLLLRAPTLADIPAAVALMNAVSMAEQGVRQEDEAHLAHEWATDHFDLATDARFALDVEGRPIGYIEVWDRPPHVHPFIWGCVHPDYQGRGIGTGLMDWAEARAARVVNDAPAGARVSVRASTVSTNERAARLLTRRGYRPVRHFWRMVRELEPAVTPEPPDWPEGITLRPYFPGLDDRLIHRVVMDSFRDHWGFIEEPFEAWRRRVRGRPDFDPSLWLLAVTTASGGDEIVGVALCSPAAIEDPDMGWVGSLGVLREWRRRGIARALLQYAIGEFYRRGQARVGLGVDAASLTGATRLYEEVGMRVVRQWDQYEKVLREGQEIAIESLD
ncbi:MAG: GNAT family N-acetyltransferase [Anaerolineae bacterium]|nr:GNAT family N-acetyltransferase [Anaerolineae bacterium]